MVLPDMAAVRPLEVSPQEAKALMLAVMALVPVPQQQLSSAS
jgi:hypothetical protein